MKKAATFLLLLVCCACSRNGQVSNINTNSKPALAPALTAEQSFYQQLDRDILEVMHVTLLLPDTSALRSWRKDLQNLRSYLQKELPQCQGKKFIIVLQTHDGFGNKGPLDPIVASSQKKVAATLNQLRPRLLGIEGSYMGNFSRESYGAELTQSVKELIEVLGGKQVSDPGDPSELDWYLSRDASMKYAHDNPDCHSYGAEWRGLHMLDFVMGMPNVPPVAHHAFRTQSRIRSWALVARAGEVMRREKLSEVVIVIGKNHRQDFEQLATLYNLNFVYHPTE